MKNRYGNSLSRWSVWTMYATVVPIEAMTASATQRWARARMSSWKIHRNPQNSSDLDELQPHVVDAEQADERRQHQRPHPRVHVWAEAVGELSTAKWLSLMI